MAIFPIVDEDVIIEQPVFERGINFLYNFNENDFYLKDGKFIEVIGDAAVAFWIEKTLQTEWERATVYNNTEYGTKFDELRGNILPNEIAKNIFETNIKDSLLRHTRISSIDNFKFWHVDSNVYIEFEVKLNDITELLLSNTSEEGYTRISTLDDIKKFTGIVRLITADGFLFRTNLGKQVYVEI